MLLLADALLDLGPLRVTVVITLTCFRNIGSSVSTFIPDWGRGRLAWFGGTVRILNPEPLGSRVIGK